jgi:hypothetical protein
VFASLSSVALGASQLTLHVIAGGLLILAAAAWSALGSSAEARQDEPGAQ